MRPRKSCPVLSQVLFDIFALDIMFIGSSKGSVIQQGEQASERAREEGKGRSSSKEAERLCMVAPLNKFLREVEQIVNLKVSDTDSSADMRMRTHSIPLTRGYRSERSASSNPPPQEPHSIGARI